MQYIPALSSILSPEHLAAYVIRQYGFAQDTTCRILKTGINHTYLVSTPDKKYVFRVYFLDWKTETEIAEELRLLTYLKEQGIPVSYPIQDKSSTYIQLLSAVEGKRFGVLFSFAEGASIRNPCEQVCYHLGTTMAKLHQATVNKTLNRKKYDAETLAGWAHELSRSHFPSTSDEMQYLERASLLVSSVFERADSDNLRHGIVHLDLWYENMKIKDASHITIFDFDNCGNGWLFLDMAYSVMLFFRNEPNKEEFIKKRDSFYRGYKSVSNITEEEKRLIPYGGLAIWLYYHGIHVQRFNDFSNQFLSEDFLKYWLQTVNQWMLFHNIKI